MFVGRGRLPHKIDVTLGLSFTCSSLPSLTCFGPSPLHMLQPFNLSRIHQRIMPVSGHDDITDDYVTELLKRDAKAVSSGSSSLASLMNKRCHPLASLSQVSHRLCLRYQLALRQCSQAKHYIPEKHPPPHRQPQLGSAQEGSRRIKTPSPELVPLSHSASCSATLLCQRQAQS